MVTYTPLEKEFNVMTQEDLDRLMETYSVPTGIQARIPDEGETILSTRLGEGQEKYFKVLVVLNSKTFQKFFALDCEGMSSGSGTTLRASSRMGLNWRHQARRQPKEPKPALTPMERTLENTGNALGPGASMLGSASVVEKILSRVILPADKEKVDKLSLGPGGYQVLPHHRSKLEGLMAEFGEREKKAAKKLKEKSDVMARLEEEVAELKNNKVLLKKKAMEEYKSSEDFQEAVKSAASKNFWRRREEKKKATRERARLVPSLLEHLYFCKLFSSFPCNGDI
ncbi:hypothetical protein Acr_01g0003310 [Actinidia rufa]|uniref:Uncharacterized protein n=1 Tax=Actinidia rufa TaxID=165716 RepID=A0A7J0E2R6_9ERIC|nr:hypothetical protein Acr_01g0003310 [Actinidia rufa]